MTLVRMPTRAVKRRDVALKIDGGPTSPYVVYFVGSSSTAGDHATNAHYNYVNRLSAKLLTHVMNSKSNRQVYVSTSGSPARGGAGMWFHNGGFSGKTSATYIDAGRKAVIDSIQPELMIHMIGSNDYLDQMSLVTYKANLQAVYDDVQTRTGGKTKHAFIHSYQRNDIGTQPITWAQYGQALEEFCNANRNCYFYNISARWAAVGVPGADPYGMMNADNVHCSDKGYKFLAETVADEMELATYHGELVYSIDPDLLTQFANNTEITSAPYPTGVLETVVPGVGQTAGQRPVRLTNALNSKSVIKFDGTDDSLDATFAKSYGLPLTVVFAVKELGTGGSSPAPIFSRTSSDSMGYIYGFDGKTGNPVTKITMMSNAGENDFPYPVWNNKPYVIAVVFDANDEQRIFISALTPVLSKKLIGADLTQGPFISSLRLGSNTGRTTFSPVQLGKLDVYQGQLTDSEIATKMNDLATRYGVAITPEYVSPMPLIRGNAVASDEIGTPLIADISNASVGDIMVLYLLKYDTSTAIPIPTDWTEVFNTTFGGSRFACFFKRKDLSDGSTVAAVMGTGQNISYCVALKDCAGLSDYATSNATTNGTSITSPSVTTARDNALILRQAGTSGNSTTSTSDHVWPTGQNELLDYKGPSLRCEISTAWSIQSPPGASGTVTVNGWPTGPRFWSTIAAMPLIHKRYHPANTILSEEAQLSASTDLATRGWTDMANGAQVFNIDTFAIVATTTSNRRLSAYYNNTALSSQNMWAKAEVAVAPTSTYTCGFVLRASTTNAYFFSYSSSAWRIYWGDMNNSSTSTSIGNELATGSLPRALIPGDIIWARANGTTLEMWMNDTLIGTWTGADPFAVGNYAGIHLSRLTSGAIRFFEAGVI